jgi:hypothetical protein
MTIKTKCQNFKVPFLTESLILKNHQKDSSTFPFNEIPSDI